MRCGSHTGGQNGGTGPGPHWLELSHFSVVVLGCIDVVAVYLLWRGQRDNGKNTFDAWDLIMDTLPDAFEANVR